MTIADVLTILTILSIVCGFLFWLSKFIISEVQIHLVVPFQIKIESMLNKVNFQIDKLTKIVEMLNKDSVMTKTDVITWANTTNTLHERVDALEQRFNNHIEGGN